MKNAGENDGCILQIIGVLYIAYLDYYDFLYYSFKKYNFIKIAF